MNIDSFRLTRAYKFLRPLEKKLFWLFAVIFVVGLFSTRSMIDKKYGVDAPDSGGTLTEGIIGAPRFVNPILMISDADYAVSNLVYSGLLRPDGKKGMEPDLAEKYEISENGLEYTFTLKNNLKWQDGEPITSDDVLFTIQQAKNPTVKSSKRAIWEGVNAEKIDERTVRFSLGKPYGPFLENAAMGILPKHIWEKISPEQMILSEWNIKAVGSGPYKINNIEKDSSGVVSSYELVANKKFALGKPLISKIILKFFPSEKELIAALNNGGIDSASALSPQTVNSLTKKDIAIKTLSLPRAFGVFFNQNNAPILAKKEVRAALEYSVNKQKILDEILLGYGVQLDYPIPPDTLGAMPQKKTEQDNFSPDKAKQVLEKAGWVFNKDEKIWEMPVASKNKKTKTPPTKLEFSLATTDTPDLKKTAELIKATWEKMGAKVNLKIYEISDLNQNIIRPRKYDALLFGEIVGRDPDLFAFWHSSQRNDPGLNIAMYANVLSDKLMEEARGLSDPKLREEKYQAVQAEIEKDKAAIFLYSPRFIYVLPKNLKNVESAESINIPSERFSQVYKWHLNTKRIWKIFAN